MNKPNVEYNLESSIVGKIEKKTPVVLQDTEGNKLNAPWAPNPNCKKCYGRGFVGRELDTSVLIPCRKCYPFNKNKK